MKRAAIAAIVLILIGILGVFLGIFTYAIGHDPRGIRLIVPILGAIAVCIGAGLLIAVGRRRDKL